MAGDSCGCSHQRIQGLDLVIVVICLAGFTWQTIDSIHDYLSYPIYTEMKVIPFGNKSQMGAVALCVPYHRLNGSVYANMTIEEVRQKVFSVHDVVDTCTLTLPNLTQVSCFDVTRVRPYTDPMCQCFGFFETRDLLIPASELSYRVNGHLDADLLTFQLKVPAVIQDPGARFWAIKLYKEYTPMTLKRGDHSKKWFLPDTYRKLVYSFQRASSNFMPLPYRSKCFKYEDTEFMTRENAIDRCLVRKFRDSVTGKPLWPPFVYASEGESTSRQMDRYAGSKDQEQESLPSVIRSCRKHFPLIECKQRIYWLNLKSYQYTDQPFGKVELVIEYFPPTRSHIETMPDMTFVDHLNSIGGIASIWIGLSIFVPVSALSDAVLDTAKSAGERQTSSSTHSQGRRDSITYSRNKRQRTGNLLPGNSHITSPSSESAGVTQPLMRRAESAAVAVISEIGSSSANASKDPHLLCALEDPIDSQKDGIRSGTRTRRTNDKRIRGTEDKYSSRSGGTRKVGRVTVVMETLVYLMCCSGCIVQLKDVLMIYCENPFATIYRTKPPEQVSMPRVTVCAPRIVNESKLRDRYPALYADFAKRNISPTDWSSELTIQQLFNTSLSKGDVINLKKSKVVSNPDMRLIPLSEYYTVRKMMNEKTVCFRTLSPGTVRPGKSYPKYNRDLLSIPKWLDMVLEFDEDIGDEIDFYLHYESNFHQSPGSLEKHVVRLNRNRTLRIRQTIYFTRLRKRLFQNHFTSRCIDYSAKFRQSRVIMIERCVSEIMVQRYSEVPADNFVNSNFGTGLRFTRNQSRVQEVVVQCEEKFAFADCDVTSIEVSVEATHVILRGDTHYTRDLGPDSFNLLLYPPGTGYLEITQVLRFEPVGLFAFCGGIIGVWLGLSFLHTRQQIRCLTIFCKRRRRSQLINPPQTSAHVLMNH